MAIGHVLSRAPKWVKSQSVNKFLITFDITWYKHSSVWMGRGRVDTTHSTVVKVHSGKCKKRIKSIVFCVRLGCIAA
jgi:hypothetical protein